MIRAEMARKKVNKIDPKGKNTKKSYFLRIKKKVLKIRRSLSGSKIPASSPLNFKLLQDKPLDGKEEDEVRFGHPQIALTLEQIIRKTRPPFTIGLFGKWGTGKSTIIGILKGYLQKSNIKTVYFDAWKYEGDSFRRQFLITLDEDLGLNLKYRKILNQTLNEPIDLGLYRSLVDILKGLLLPFIAVLILFLIYFFARRQLDLTSTISSSSSINQSIIDHLFDFSIIGIILSFLLSTFKVSYGSVEIHKTDSAEGFEERFDEVLNKISEDKILVIIDNLDRTHYSKATQLLSDIKTFLSSDSDSMGNKCKVIFLIACDDDAIRNHLKKSNFDNPKEFMRKFFNTSLRIPIFLDVDLDMYIQELVRKAKVKAFIHNDQLVWLIAYAFRSNPREIKQFINSLVTQYILAKNMYKSKQIRSKEITDNVAFLAKIEVIKQKYPTFYLNIEESAIRKGLEWKDIDSAVEGFTSFPGLALPKTNKTKEEVVDFIQNTKDIPAGYLPFFVSLRQSSEEQKLNNWQIFRLAAQDKKIEEANLIFEKIKKHNQLDILDQLSWDFLRQNRRTEKSHYSERMLSFASVLIRVSNSDLNYLKRFLPHFIEHFPDQSDLLKHILDFPPNIFIESVYNLQSKINKKRLTSAYVSILAFAMGNLNNQDLIEQDTAKDIFRVVIAHPEYFEDERKIVSESIEKRFHQVDIMELFEKNEDVKKMFVSDQAIENLIGTISIQDCNNIEVLRQKLDCVNKLYD